MLYRTYRRPRSTVAQALDSLLRSRHLIVEEREVWQQAISLFASTPLQMTDCYIASRALRDGVDVHTFDHDLAGVMRRSKPAQ